MTIGLPSAAPFTVSIKMTILNNAVDSIIIGIEDYQSTDPRRLLAATRNLVAGIHFLYKHKSASLSPTDADEALIKQLA